MLTRIQRCIGCFGECRITCPLAFISILVYVNKHKPCSWRRDRATPRACRWDWGSWAHTRDTCSLDQGRTVTAPFSHRLPDIPAWKGTSLVRRNSNEPFETRQGESEYGVRCVGGGGPLVLLARYPKGIFPCFCFSEFFSDLKCWCRNGYGHCLYWSSHPLS